MHSSLSKKRFAQFEYSVSFLCVLCVLCVLCALSVQIRAQDFKTVHPGVEYAQVLHKIGSDPVKINLLRLDLKKVRLDVHHALDRAIGVETTSSIAKRHGAVAAINAGFFRLDRSAFAGDAAGVLVIDGRPWSESVNDRVGIVISNGASRTQVTFHHVKAEITLSYSGDVVQTLSGINRERKSDEIIAYTPSFGRSTLSDSLGTEIIFSACGGPCRVAVIRNSGNSVIPPDGFVLSIGPGRIQTEKVLIDFMTLAMGSSHKTWARLDLRSKETGDRRLTIRESDDVTNGIPQLIRNGRIDITWEQEKAGRSFVETRHPRTAVAKLNGGKLLLITVDGRQPGISVGMSLQELAEYLLSVGATDAMNLDGGGSTAMFLDGRVVNTPSDKDGERKVSDAIVVTLRRKF